MIPRGAVVQLQGYQKLVKIAQAQVDSLKHIGDLIRQAQRRRGDIAF